LTLVTARTSNESDEAANSLFWHVKVYGWTWLDFKQLLLAPGCLWAILMLC
jgi:hypothetical protein